MFAGDIAMSSDFLTEYIVDFLNGGMISVRGVHDVTLESRLRRLCYCSALLLLSMLRK